MISRARKNNHAHPPVAASNRQHSHASTSPQYGHSHIHASIRFPQYSQLTPSALFVFLALSANMGFSLSNLLYFMNRQTYPRRLLAFIEAPLTTIRLVVVDLQV